MKSLRAFLFTLFLTGCQQSVYHVTAGSGVLRTEYWVRPDVHNLNGKTHVCGYLYAGTDGQWVAYDVKHDVLKDVEPSHTITHSREAAVKWIETLCGHATKEGHGL